MTSRAFEIARQVRRNPEATPEDMAAALRADPAAAAWVVEKGEDQGGRELRRLWERPSPSGGLVRPAILITGAGSWKTSSRRKPRSWQADDAAAETDDSGLSSEAQAVFDSLKQLLGELDAKIVRAVVLDDLEIRNAPLDRANIGFAGSLHQFELRGMIAARIGADPDCDIGGSREISAELARRTTRRRIEGIATPVQALSSRTDYVAGQYQAVSDAPWRRLDHVADHGTGRQFDRKNLQQDRYVGALRA